MFVQQSVRFSFCGPPRPHRRPSFSLVSCFLGLLFAGSPLSSPTVVGGSRFRYPNDSRFITAIGTVIALDIFSDFFEEVRHREHCTDASS